MKAAIIGMGWAAPGGADLDTVWRDLQEGRVSPPDVETQSSDSSESVTHPGLRVPDDFLREAMALPRLRRSSRISHLAVTAACQAVADAGLNADQLANTALIFTTSDGGISYSRRFFADIVEGRSGSPLLFPETVYNAPTSHIAARLGLSGEALSIPGDAAAGLAAARLACGMISAGDVEYCLVVSAQEPDPISVEAYARLGLIRGADSANDTVAIFSEGAAALVLAREGECFIHAPEPGFTYTSRSNAGRHMKILIARLLESYRPDVIVSGQSGIPLDIVEERTFGSLLSGVPVLKPKSVLGESLANSSVQNIMVASKALSEAGKGAEVLVAAVGFNGQLGALILTDACRKE